MTWPPPGGAEQLGRIAALVLDPSYPTNNPNTINEQENTDMTDINTSILRDAIVEALGDDAGWDNQQINSFLRHLNTTHGLESLRLKLVPTEVDITATFTVTVNLQGVEVEDEPDEVDAERYLDAVGISSYYIEKELGCLNRNATFDVEFDNADVEES